MWGDSWINLSLKLQDIPYYKGLREKKENDGAKKGTVEVLEQKFSRYRK